MLLRNATEVAPSFRLLAAGWRFNTPSEGGASAPAPSAAASPAASVAPAAPSSPTPTKAAAPPDITEAFKDIKDRLAGDSVTPPENVEITPATPKPKADEKEVVAGDDAETDGGEDDESGEGSGELNDGAEVVDVPNAEANPVAPPRNPVEYKAELSKRFDAALAPYADDLAAKAQAVKTAADAVAALNEEFEQAAKDGDPYTFADKKRSDAAEKALQAAQKAEAELAVSVRPAMDAAADSLRAEQRESQIRTVAGKHDLVQYIPEMRELVAEAEAGKATFPTNPDDLRAILESRHARKGKVPKKAAPTEQEADDQRDAAKERSRRAARLTQGRSGGAGRPNAPAATDLGKGLGPVARQSFDKFARILSGTD